MAKIKDVLYNDGEGANPIDFNNAQRFLRAQQLDMGLVALGNLQDTGVGPGSLNRRAHAWCLGDSAAPYPTATALKIDTLSGPLFQWRTGTPDMLLLNLGGTDVPAGWGDDPYALAYWVQGTKWDFSNGELATTHAIGGAQPRWDVVSFALAVANGDTEARDVEDAVTRQPTSQVIAKRRNVTITKVVTQGTEGATPNVPALPAGHVGLYAVYVPAGHNAVFTHEHIWDFRMPLGSFSIDSLALDCYARQTGNANMHISGGGVTPRPGGYGSLICVNNSELWFTPLGVVPHSARLVGVEALIGRLNSAADFNIARINGALGGEAVPGTVSRAPGLAASPNISAALRGNPSAANSEFRGSQLGMNAFTNGAGGLESVPVWITGCPTGYASRPEAGALGADDLFNRVCLRYVAGTAFAEISAIRFHFAGGL